MTEKNQNLTDAAKLRYLANKAGMRELFGPLGVEALLDIAGNIDKLEYALGKFGEWYSSEGCPWTEHGFCPDFDKVKKEFDDEQEAVDEEDRYEFDPSEECGVDCQGACFIEYYKYLYEKKNEKAPASQDGGDLPEGKVPGAEAVRNNEGGV